MKIGSETYTSACTGTCAHVRTPIVRCHVGIYQNRSLLPSSFSLIMYFPDRSDSISSRIPCWGRGRYGVAAQATYQRHICPRAFNAVEKESRDGWGRRRHWAEGEGEGVGRAIAFQHFNVTLYQSWKKGLYWHVPLVLLRVLRGFAQMIVHILAYLFASFFVLGRR